MTYNIGTVSPSAVAGMVFSLVVAFALPVTLFILAKRKLGAKTSAAVTGASVFAVFVLGLESALSLLLSKLGVLETLMANIYSAALFGGLIAALFEEFGRLFAMKLCMKRTLSKENALMYGVGHGGLEAMAIVGVAYISNLYISSLINSGALSAQLSALSADAAAQFIASISALWETEPATFFLAGVERISAITLQICLSYFVYRAARYGEKRFFALAFVLHCAVDALSAILVGVIGVYAFEALLLVAMAAIAFFAARLYRAEAPDAPDAPAPDA